MRQMMMWFCTSPRFFFEEGDTYTYSNGTGSRPYKFTLGEIVRRRYKTNDSSEWEYDEVIVFGEKGYLVDVLTIAELWQAGTRNNFTTTKIVWVDDVEPLNPKRFFMEKDAILELIDKEFSLR